MINLKEFCKHYNYNYTMLRDEFKTEDELFLKSISLTTLLTLKKLDISKVYEFYNKIRYTSKYSKINGDLSLAFAVSVSQRDSNSTIIANNIRLEGSADEILDNAVAILNMFKKDEYISYNYIIISAYTLSLLIPNNFEKYVESGNRIFERASKDSSNVMCDEDYIYKTLIATLEIEDNRFFENISYLKLKLSNEFNNYECDNIALILSYKYNESLDYKLNNFLQLKKILEESNLVFENIRQIICLAILSLHDISITNIKEDLLQVMDEITNFEAFSIWSCSKERKIMFAIAILSFYYINNISNDNFIFPKGINGLHVAHANLIAMLIVRVIAIGRI